MCQVYFGTKLLNVFKGAAEIQAQVIARGLLNGTEKLRRTSDLLLSDR